MLDSDASNDAVEFENTKTDKVSVDDHLHIDCNEVASIVLDGNNAKY